MAMQQSCGVMVVDDDAGVRDMLELVLEDEGFDVRSARNGQEALDQLRTQPVMPCLILLDLNMPIMTGWEFRNVQKHDPSLATIPVAVISADRSVRQQPFNIDALAYFQKPIDFDGLLSLVHQCCR